MTTGKSPGGSKPWEALGMSKSTYYRKQGNKGQQGAPTSRRAPNPTEDAVNRALAKQARIQLEQAIERSENDTVTFKGTVDLFVAVVDMLRKAGM